MEHSFQLTTYLRYLKSVTACAFLVPVLSHAELVQMDDAQMSDVSGQAMLDVVTLTDPGGTSGDFAHNTAPTKFVRIRTGAKVEINANIKRLILGEYARDDKYTSYSTQFYREKKDYRDELFYADANALKNCGTAGNPGCYIPGSDIGVKTGADLIIENLSLGAVENGVLKPMVMENPYIELAYENSGPNKGKLIGIRLGAESQTGHLGNYSEYGVGAKGCLGSNAPSTCTTSNGTPYTTAGKDPDTTRTGGVLSLSGNFNLIAGNTGLIGNSVIQGVARTNTTPVKGGFLSGALHPNATQTLGDISHKDTKEFYLSLASREIQYPFVGSAERMQLSDGNAYGKNGYYAALPGVSLNITDGIALTLPQALGTLNGGIPKLPNCYNGNSGAC